MKKKLLVIAISLLIVINSGGIAIAAEGSEPAEFRERTALTEMVKEAEIIEVIEIQEEPTVSQ